MAKVKLNIKNIEKYIPNDTQLCSSGYTKLLAIDFKKGNNRTIDIDGRSVFLSMTNVVTIDNDYTCVGCGEKATYYAIHKLKNRTKDYYNISFYHLLDGMFVPHTKDHIVPKANGGRDAYINYQNMCNHCNESKGNNNTTSREQTRILSRNHDKKHKTTKTSSLLTSIKVHKNSELGYRLYEGEVYHVDGYTIMDEKRYHQIKANEEIHDGINAWLDNPPILLKPFKKYMKSYFYKTFKKKIKKNDRLKKIFDKRNHYAN